VTGVTGVWVYVVPDHWLLVYVFELSDPYHALNFVWVSNYQSLIFPTP